MAYLMILYMENVMAISKFTNEPKSHDEVGRLHPICLYCFFPSNWVATPFQLGGDFLFQMIELLILIVCSPTYNVCK